MQNEFSKKAEEILNNAKKLSNDAGIYSCGSEFLIQAMYDVEDSLCHFILEEYDVKKEEVIEASSNLYIIRKNKNEYNKTMDTIIHQAKLLAGNKAIDDEHLFMAILMNPSSIACSILVDLGLDIESLILDVKEIYEFNKSEELAYVKNISNMAKKCELMPFIGRSELLFRMDLILNRKTKSNPLLIGNAGVGKTALVEGYANLLAKRNSPMEVISLNLTSMLAGTKYRGDFEQRFDEFSKTILTKKNVILFIDEIHTIMGAGTTDGNLDIANMLKPYLARSDIKIIGATTLEEYHKSMSKDKALCRRFQPIYVLEPSLEETKTIVFGIRDNYSNFHNVKISDEYLDYLICESNRRIPSRNRPDKCIDILDDTLTYAKINKEDVNKNTIDKTIDRFIGCNEVKAYNPHYKCLEKYVFLASNNLMCSNTLLKIKYNGSKEKRNILIADCINLFKASDEMVLKLDFREFSDTISMTSLIGAPPGYVGYDDDGILTKHLAKYQIPIICIDNYEKGSKRAQGIIRQLMETGEIYDAKGNIIKGSNAIFIVSEIKKNNNVGFMNNEITYNDEIYDEVINEENDIVLDYTKLYKKQLAAYNIEIADELLINKNNKRKIDEKIFEYVKQGDFSKHFLLK